MNIVHRNLLSSLRNISCSWPSFLHIQNYILIRTLCMIQALNLVSIEDAVKLSTRMRRLSPLSWCLFVVEYCHAEGHYWLVRFKAFKLSSFRPHEKGFKRQTVCQRQRNKNCNDDLAQRTVNRILWSMRSFEDGTSLLRETMTILRSRDVIHWGPASFWCMKHVPVSVIIPVLKKKALLFYSPSSVGRALNWRICRLPPTLICNALRINWALQ